MDRLDLAPLVATYGPYLRSLRVVRGLAGNGVFVIAAAPLGVLIVLPFLSEPVDALLTVAVGLVFTVFAAIAIATYESLAACTFAAIRAAVISLLVIAASRLAAVLAALAGTDWRWQVTLPVLLGLGLNLTVLGTIARGLVPLMSRQRDFERRLFRVHARERSRFFLPLPALVRDMCRMAGLVVAPRSRRLDRVAVAAALAAFALEGSVYYTYLQAGFNVSKHARKLADTEFPTVAAVAFATLGPLVSLAIGRFFFAQSARLRGVALRRSVFTATELQRDDARPPVLFLRSFRDDQVSLAAAPVPLAFKFFDPGIEVRTLETLVVRNLTPVGPVIAIGNPTDRLPPLGAARAYLENEDWQAVVRSLIAEARMVVMGLDDTPGVGWELRELAAQGALSRTLVIVPPSPADVRQRYLAALTQAVGAASLPVVAPSSHPIALVFGDDGAAVPLLSNRSTELEYDVALRLAERWICDGDRPW